MCFYPLKMNYLCGDKTDMEDSASLVSPRMQHSPNCASPILHWLPLFARFSMHGLESRIALARPTQHQLQPHGLFLSYLQCKGNRGSSSNPGLREICQLTQGHRRSEEGVISREPKGAKMWWKLLLKSSLT